MAKSNKAFFWSLFAGGGMVAAFLIPVMIFLTGLAIPLGLMPADMLAYERVSAVAAHPLGKLVLFGVVFLTLWHAAHRLRPTLHDLGVHMPRLVMIVCYGLAIIGSVAAAVFLLRI